MTWLTEIESEPWRFDFYDVMRRMERNHPALPRIGQAATSREDYVRLGQDTFSPSRLRPSRNFASSTRKNTAFWSSSSG